ncbi:hypothetical protein XENOCAPTIV_002821, partial [Xenoophorus captivus]
MSDSMIMDAIASFLVLPNRLVVPLVPDLHVAQLRCPLPRGVVRIHLLEAQNLEAKDNYVKGVMAGLSDPYAILRVGPQTFTSKHIDNTDCPKWGEMYETCYTTINPEWEEAFTFFIQDPRSQDISIQVKDADRVQTLGSLSIPLSRVLETSHLSLDQWFQLGNSGTVSRIYINAVLRVLQFYSRQSYQNKTVPSAGLLFVFVEQADGLPLSHSWTLPIGSLIVPIRELLAEPDLSLVAKDKIMGGLKKGKSDPYAKINVGEVIFKSAVVKENLNPVVQLQSLQSYHNKAVPSAALLFVYMDRAHLVVTEIISISRWKNQYMKKSQKLSHTMRLKDTWSHRKPKLRRGLAQATVTGLPFDPASSAKVTEMPKVGPSYDTESCKPPTRPIVTLEELHMVWTLPCTSPAPGNGQVKLSLSYASKERKLVVIVHACRCVLKLLRLGLLSQNKDAVDSYVSLMLLPDKSKATKKKTAVRKKDLNPEYNERFEYDLPENEARFRRLGVSVKNNSASFRSRDVIGQ